MTVLELLVHFHLESEKVDKFYWRSKIVLYFDIRVSWARVMSDGFKLHHSWLVLEVIQNDLNEDIRLGAPQHICSVFMHVMADRCISQQI